MNAANVHKLVHAISDAHAVHAEAAKQTHDGTALRLRVEALEALLECITDVMLSGTSADPAAPSPTAPVKAKKAAKK